jgi:four helix bundle protein
MGSGKDGVPGFIPPHGGYEELASYQKALIIFQATYYLAAKWVRMGSRTRDQMEQSARSGKQNIVEGSLASATSKQTEIHLTNVAKASLGELLEDHKDFLRVTFENWRTNGNVMRNAEEAKLLKRGAVKDVRFVTGGSEGDDR